MIKTTDSIESIRNLQISEESVRKILGKNAASLLGNLKHWLKDDEEIQNLMDKIPGIQREEICKKL